MTQWKDPVCVDTEITDRIPVSCLELSDRRTPRKQKEQSVSPQLWSCSRSAGMLASVHWAASAAACVAFCPTCLKDGSGWRVLRDMGQSKGHSASSKEGKRVILWQFLDWVYHQSQVEFPGWDIKQPPGHQENSLVCQERMSFLFFLYWDIVALQCCVGFCSTGKWSRYPFTYTPLFGFPSHLGHHSAWRRVPCSI